MSTTEGELDVEVHCELEDGELEDSDLEGGTYKPLQRPENFNPTSIMNMQIQDDQTDESVQESSGSDSDSITLTNRPKKPKAKMRRMTSSDKEAVNKRKKFNIWCSAAQEDVLSETMTGCDVTQSRHYGVESYDYTIKYRLDNNFEKRAFVKDIDSNKRSYSERKSVKQRLGRRINPDYEEIGPSESAEIPDLRVCTTDSAHEVAEDIAAKLREEKKSLIMKIVEIVGVSKAIELYKETKRIEADGGMLIMNGMRRRTPGGVYIFTLKKDPEITADMVKTIFQDHKQQTSRNKRRTQAKHRQLKVEQLKQTLNESELPALGTRAEVTVPPPSPATDCRDSDTDPHAHASHPLNQTPAHSSQNNDSDVECHRRSLDAEDEDFLDIHCQQDIDMF